MTIEPLTSNEKQLLLTLARQSIQSAVHQQPLAPLKLEDYSPALRADGAAFVTLTIGGELRGCVGALQAFQPLVQDVCEHAVAAALEDYRFRPVSPVEVSLLEIEISRLTPPQPLDYSQPVELATRLHPGHDGVILRDGIRRATFLPQVWEKVPDVEDFLTHLCLKMGAPGDLWRRKLLQVSIYHVEEFSEESQRKVE